MAIRLPETAGEFEERPNVVPMIDILLVLLIIFMMQVALSRKAMDVQVPPPPEEMAQQEQPPQTQIVLELKDDGSYEINKEPVALAQLYTRLRSIYDARPSKIIFIKTAANRRYQEVIEAIDISRGAGVQVVGYAPAEAQ